MKSTSIAILIPLPTLPLQLLITVAMTNNMEGRSISPRIALIQLAWIRVKFRSTLGTCGDNIPANPAWLILEANKKLSPECPILDRAELIVRTLEFNHG
jgi:hypothetical protein